MGVDYNMSVVVGVVIRPDMFKKYMFKQEPKIEKVKRYDEVTGKAKMVEKVIEPGGIGLRFLGQVWDLEAETLEDATSDGTNVLPDEFLDALAYDIGCSWWIGGNYYDYRGIIVLTPRDQRAKKRAKKGSVETRGFIIEDTDCLVTVDVAKAAKAMPACQKIYEVARALGIPVEKPALYCVQNIT
jgi:maleate cis-trans isomerase